MKRCRRNYVEAGVAAQRKVDRYRDKNQHLVVSIKGRKLQLMYQQREKSCRLNLLMTSLCSMQFCSNAEFVSEIKLFFL